MNGSFKKVMGIMQLKGAVRMLSFTKRIASFMLCGGMMLPAAFAVDMTSVPAADMRMDGADNLPVPNYWKI